MNRHLGTRRRLLLSALVVVLTAFGLPLLTMGPASAHTPNLTKSCSGVTVSGSSYEAANTNTLGIRIDNGPWTTKTFATDGTLTVAVPQDGEVHSYNAYVHTTNSNPAYSHDYSGTVGPCGQKTHVTAALFTKTDPTCSADGSLVIPQQPAGVLVQRNPSSGTGPGHYTITFTAQSGYVIDGPTSQTIDVLPKLTGDQCATTVQPVAPTVTNPACTGPGTGTPGSIVLPADGNGISYSKAGNVVTATADATHKFGSLPAGWSLVDAHHATYTVTFTSPDGYPDCLVEATPVNPTVEQSVCTGPGTHSDPVITFGDVPGDHIGYAYDAAGHVVTATPDAGYTLANLPSGWTAHQDGTATYQVTLTDPGACLVQVDVPTPPTASAPTCNTDGQLTVAPTTHVVTTVDGDEVTDSTDFGPGVHVIEYAPAAGYAFAPETTTSFPVVVEPMTKDCPASVVSPTVTQSVCTGPGTHSDPVVHLGDVDGDHVSYVYDSTSHLVTATPDAGFVLADLPDGWTLLEGGTATYQVVLTNPGTCEVIVSPPTTPAHHPPTATPGALPNTGGPSPWLAAAGLLLLLGGAGLVTADRRRRAVARR